jgi:hypothetical protein
MTSSGKSSAADEERYRVAKSSTINSGTVKTASSELRPSLEPGRRIDKRGYRHMMDAVASN